jgi:large subunit ribosomal protein L10
VKNSLIKKALGQLDSDYSEAFSALKMTSAVFFSSEENASVPAKVIKTFRGSKKEIPQLKAAVIDTAVFLGDDQLDALTRLKTKAEMIGEVIGLLQSPAKNVISALQSGGHTLAGLVKTLQERAEAS